MASLSRYIGIINRCAMLYRNDKTGLIGITGHQYPYLIEIIKNPGISQEALAKLVVASKSSVTRHLAGLEKWGYIRRSQCGSDKRVLHVYPTEKADGVLSVMQEALRGWNGYITEGLDAKNLKICLEAMKYMAGRAEEYVKSGEIREEDASLEPDISLSEPV